MSGAWDMDRINRDLIAKTDALTADLARERERCKVLEAERDELVRKADELERDLRCLEAELESDISNLRAERDALRDALSRISYTVRVLTASVLPGPITRPEAEGVSGKEKRYNCPEPPK